MQSIPEIKPAREIDIIGYEKIRLSSGIPCFGFNGAAYDIINIDLVFDSGRWTETKRQTAAFTAKMLKQGTVKRAHYQITEEIDFWGGTIRIGQRYNSVIISVYCILKNLEPILKVLNEILTESNFPEEELTHQKEKKIINLQTNLQKTEFVADEAFKQKIFGENHPYGYPLLEKDIQAIERQDLIYYFTNCLTSENLYILLSGKYDKSTIKLIDKYLPKQSFNPQYQKPEVPDISPSKEMKFHQKLEKAEQASLIIGKQSFGPETTGYYDLMVLNNILGGYFGSRLMKNIREDKGYTYGIHSELTNYKNASLFSISTEVGKEYVEPCISEIYKEMQRLKNEEVSKQELERVRNYMMGKLLRLFDGPFNTKNTYMSMWNSNRDIEHLSAFINSIKTVTSKRLLDLANQFFDENSLYEVLVD